MISNQEETQSALEMLSPQTLGAESGAFQADSSENKAEIDAEI